jgi:integrase
LPYTPGGVKHVMSVIQSSNEKEDEIYFNFINSIKSDVTKEIYQYNIKIFMKFCKVENFYDLFSIENPQTQIIKHLAVLREKGLSSNSISTRLNAIYHFYDMNDVPLNKKKINMFKGESTRKVVDRAYFRDEIKKILDVSDLRTKTIVLLMASSGLRIGSLPDLRIRNLEKINNIYKITVYEGSNSQYYTFCTPECASFIDAYLEYRTRNGEKIDEKSHLIRDQFDITDLEQIRNRSKGISVSTIGNLMDTILLKAGVKIINHTSQFERKEVARAHGFRKFFTTQCINAKINSEIREMFLGHKIGLASCYYRPTEDEMYQEYLKAVDKLTINEENRLKLELKQVQIEKSKLDELKEDFLKFKQEVLKQRSRN